MTRPPLSDDERIASAPLVAPRVANNLAASLRELGSRHPFSEDWLESLDPSWRVPLDAFLKRFENAVEAGGRLFRAALTQAREDHRGLSTGEVADLMERLGLIDSSDRSAAIVAARNAVAHEYSVEPDEAAGALSEAFTAALAAHEILSTLFVRLEARFPMPVMKAERP